VSDLLPNPTHLLDTLWTDLDAAAGYRSIEVDITVETDPGEAAHYYYANTVYFARSGVDRSGALHGAAYAGLQTNGYSGPADGWVGKMALFSAWGGTHGIAEEIGWGSEFEEGGIGYSVRIPYPWSADTTYRLRIGLDKETESERLWSASLTDVGGGTTSRIGRVFVPTSFGKIRRPITFHERYAGPSANAGDVEPSQVRFTNMTANDGLEQSKRHHHTKVISVRGHPDLCWHQDIEGGVRTRAGLASPGIRD
jgi:hypothetical protein